MKKPIIVNLTGYLNERAGTEPENNFASTKKDPEIATISGINSENSHSSFMMSETDVEMKNDFNWLINFDVRKVLKHGIDEEPVEVKEKMCPVNKENCINHDIINLTDIIKECLFQKKEATIRYIYKWISSQFPCMKSRQCKWKDLVREMLYQNPMFKRKSSTGKNVLWTLSSFRNASPNFQKISVSTVCSRKSTKLRSSRQKSTRKPAQIPFKISNADAVIEDSSSCITEVDDAQIHIMPLYSTNWLGQIDIHGKNCMREMKYEGLHEYYELEVPINSEILIESTEPIDNFEFLEENNISGSLEVL